MSTHADPFQAYETRLAVLETDNSTLRERVADLEAAERAAVQERDAALATANLRIADAHARASAAEQERDVYQARAADRDKQAVRVAELEGVLVDHALAEARRAGILRVHRDDEGRVIESRAESRLRRIAREEGLDVMRAELAEMPRVMPRLDHAELSLEDPSPRPTVGGDIPRSVLESTAAQLEMDPSELVEHHAAIAGGKVGKS